MIMRRITVSEVWIFAEQRHGTLNKVSFELLNRGKKLTEKLNSTLSSILLGYCIKKEDIDELILRGADKVYVVDDKHLENFLIEPYARVLTLLLDEYNPHIFIAAATTLGRTLMPYIAIKKKTGLTADCFTNKTGNWWKYSCNNKNAKYKTTDGYRKTPFNKTSFP